MKLNGFVGKGSGKLGSSVFAVSGGKQIVRQYNPNVANPSTEGQVGQRAKLKLLSQLSSQLSSVIAIAKQGLTSARNRFVSINFPQVTWDGDEAQLLAQSIKLTASARPFQTLDASLGGGLVSVVTASGADSAIDKVALVLCRIGASGIAVVDSKIVDTDDSGAIDTSLNAPADAMPNDLVVLGYGISETEAMASGAYGNLTGAPATHLAKLIASRTVNASDVLITATTGALVVGS